MDYTEISKATISHLYKSYNSLNNSPLSQEIRMLVEVRASQINGCAYCCKFHSDEARKANIGQEKLDVLAAWENSTVFSDKERAALNWCELVTHAKPGDDQAKKWLEKHLSEREIVDLTACIAVINALNRIAICLREY